MRSMPGFAAAGLLDEALAAYERQRNEAALPFYDLTYQFAALRRRPPEMQPLFAALRDNQEETSRFFGTIAETVPVAEFFAPENIARIVRGGAESRRPRGGCSVESCRASSSWRTERSTQRTRGPGVGRRARVEVAY